MEDTSIYCFFLFTVDLDLPRQPPVAKMQNPGGDEPLDLLFGGFSKVIYYEINLKQIQASWVGINRSISQ